MPSSTVSSQHSFLSALACKNRGRPPVWIMRQAGRYLPEYQAIRKKHTLEEMFRIPELIFEITKQPLDIIGVDAAILFADILHIPLTLGVDVSFPGKGGPVCTPLIETADDLLQVHPRPVEETLSFVKEGIHLLKQDISQPLIGFCGGPFTVMTYLTGKKVKKWLYSDPESAAELLQMITDQSIAYLQMQVDAGVDALQIFDSWANLLSRAEFCRFAQLYLKQIVDAFPNTPLILFSRATSHFIPEFVSLKPSAISFDWTYPLHEIRQRVPSTIAVQGNLDPELLYAPPAVIERETKKLLTSMAGDPGFIANLGHGVLPDIPVDHVRTFVDTIKAFKLS
ncbi:uroporphyrinogen decarboxylase [Candidatus Neptunochlamydia vexilliferae]|nr:uroporphyrinogen decarboxylase [Candidatus Neptunochlamydia vexilliferae]